MKIRICILFACILSAFWGIGTAFGEALPKDTGEMVEYALPRGVFRDFIKMPSQELLESDGVRKHIYSKSEYMTGYIKRKSIYGTTISEDEAKSGVMRIGVLPVYTEFVEYIGSKSNIEQLLRDNGVYEEILAYALIDIHIGDDIPASIWVRTNNGDYFITVTGDYENPFGTEFIYKLYTKNDFCDKYGLKDGTLKVDGADITGENYVKFEYRRVYLPVRAVAEALGGSIEWDDDDKRAVIESKNGKYVLRVNEYPHFVPISDADYTGAGPTGGLLPFCAIIDGRIIAGEEIIREIAEAFNASVTVDYSNMTVEIQTERQ